MPEALQVALMGVALFVGISAGLAGPYGLWTLCAEMVTTVRSGAAESEHWSPQSERLEVSMSPFRDAPLNDVSQRGAPIWLRVAGAVAVAVGILTSCLLAPIALGVAFFSRLPEVTAALAALTAVSGLAAGVVLLVSATRAVKGNRAWYPAFLTIHYFTSTVAWVLVSASFGSMTAACLSFAYGGLGFVLTLVFAEAHKFPGASEDVNQAPSKSAF